MEATAQLFYDMMDIVLGKVGKMNGFSALSSAADWGTLQHFLKNQLCRSVVAQSTRQCCFLKKRFLPSVIA